MNIKLRKEVPVILLILLGIVARFIVMTYGHNYDFESYCIVGEIAGHFRDVYAETSRYNYGFPFFCLLGMLYRFSESFFYDPILTYRVLIVSMLTLVDIGITFIIADMHSWKTALLFFLNPVSILISGFHNQFDNIAILLALVSIYYYNEEEKIGKRDVICILLLSLSLIVKHIMFIFPVFLIVKKDLAWKKKLFYSCTPPLLFLISFFPFVLYKESREGILSNVFFYRSANNAPLLNWFYNSIAFPEQYKILVYFILMAGIAWLVRKKDYTFLVCIYLISMVCFSSAIANQYLVIPVAALFLLDTGLWKYIYILFVTTFLLLHSDGLGLIQHMFWRGKIGKICDLWVTYGYNIAVYVLLIIILFVFINDYKKRNIK